MSDVATLIPDIASSSNANKRARTPSAKQGKQEKKNPRKSSSLPSETVDYLKAWMMSPEHVAHPYPTEQEKAQIMADTGIELKQLTNWFVNNRKRYWKPRVEARLQKQQQGQVQVVASAAVVQPSKATQKNGNLAASTNSSKGSTSIVKSRVATKPSKQQQQSIGKRHIVPASSDDKPQPPQRQSSPPVPPTQGVKLVNTDDISSLVALASSAHPVSETSSSGSLGSDDNDQSSLSNDSYNDDLIVSTIIAHHNNKSEIRPVTTRRVSITEEDNLSSSSSSKRIKLTHDDGNVVQVHHQARRPNYHCKSLNLWREACLRATYVYDDELPSIEEAACLFGYEEALQ